MLKKTTKKKPSKSSNKLPSELLSLKGIHCLEALLKHRPHAIADWSVSEQALAKSYKLQKLFELSKQAKIACEFNTKDNFPIARIRPWRLAGERELQELLTSASSNLQFFMLDGITDTGNLGAIIRSLAGFQVDGLILPRNNSAAFFSQGVFSASVGAAAAIAIFQVNNLSKTCSLLKNNNCLIFGADHRGEIRLSNFAAPQDSHLSILMGAEDKGINPKLKDELDGLVAIDFAAESVESLNVSVAASLFAYRLFCQKNNLTGVSHA